jgi:serine/threonine-protein kinase
VKLLDFGLARWVDSGGVTEEGMAVGTASYMAPEQLKGLRITTAADLWALGMVLYEMLAGRRPFGGERQGMVHSILHENPLPLSEGNLEVPAVLESIVARCLAKEPRERPSAAAVASELQASGLWAGSGSGGVVPSPRRLSRRTWAAAGAATVLLVLAIAAWWLTRKPTPPVYVAVLKPEVTGSLLPDDATQVRLNLQAALLRTVAALNGLAALDTAQVNAVRGTPMEIARAVAAGEVVASQADCAGDLCQVSLRRLAGTDGRLLWSGAVRLPPSEPRLFANAVAATLRQGYQDRELNVSKLELEIDEQDYRTFLALRQRLADPQAHEELLSSFGELRQRAPAFLDAGLLEAKLAERLYLDSGEERYLDRALAVAGQARELAPDDPRPLEILFSLNLSAGRLDQAEEILEKLEEINPSSSLLPRGQLAERRGHPEEALKLMADAARLQPSWRMLLTVANAEYRLGRLDDARRHLEELLERSPGNLGGLKTLAQIELLRDPERAVALFREAVKSDPGTGSLTNLGVSLLLLQRYGEAEASLRQALAGQPDDPSAALNLADCLSLLGRPAEARRLYAGIAETADARATPGAWRMLGIQAQALAHLGETEKALETIQQALRLTPDNGQLAYEAALVFTLVGDRSSALFHVRRAIAQKVDIRWFTLPFFDPLRNEPSFQTLTRIPPLTRQN